MKKILFVCTGNTCRSPMAAALFNGLAAHEAPGLGYTAVSAGLAAVQGDPPSKNAGLALEDYAGSDLSGHRARMISCEDVNDAYLVLTMSQSHKRSILSMCPDAYQKVFTLKEYVSGFPGDIKDPYGGFPAVYRECAREIAQAVEKLVNKLKKS